jgi:hypothetical protein
VARSLDQRYARLVRSYVRLKELYDRVLGERAALREQIREQNIELRALRSHQREYEGASRNTFNKLLATTQFSITKLVEAGDLESAERLSDWLDDMREAMQPVANVNELVELLEEWIAAMPLDDASQVAALWMTTRAKVNELRGR